MRTDEHNTQVACVTWFRMQFPKMRKILLSFPNMGKRTQATARYLKNEGMTAGAPDLILLKASKGFSSLAIEMKTRIGKQSEEQKAWQKEFEENGGKYVVCRSLAEFQDVIMNYLFLIKK